MVKKRPQWLPLDGGWDRQGQYLSFSIVAFVNTPQIDVTYGSGIPKTNWHHFEGAGIYILYIESAICFWDFLGAFRTDFLQSRHAIGGPELKDFSLFCLLNSIKCVIINIFSTFINLHGDLEFQRIARHIDLHMSFLDEKRQRGAKRKTHGKSYAQVAISIFQITNIHQPLNPIQELTSGRF